MARPTKQGLDYFPLDVDFFQDKETRILKAKYGVDGISIYLYLLCEIYRNGYYLKIDDDFIYIMADDLRMGSNKIRQVLNFLLERSLFEDKLFQSDKVLTSAPIQEQFQLAVKERAKKTPIEIKDFWILEKSQTESFIKVNSFLNNSQKNEDNSQKKENNSREESIKESKVKKSIVKESKKGKTLTPEEKEVLIKEYGTDVTEDYIKRTTQYHCCNYDTIRKWIAEDKEKERSRKPKKNTFTNIPQNPYTTEDMKELEKKLLERSRKS